MSHTCQACGYQWEHGTVGWHDCTKNLRGQLDEMTKSRDANHMSGVKLSRENGQLRALVAKLRDTLDECYQPLRVAGNSQLAELIDNLIEKTKEVLP